MRQAAECRSMKLKDSLRELASWGSPLDMAFATGECNDPELVIEQSGDSQVFELEEGRIAFMLDACATNQTSKPMYVSDVSLELPWEQDFFDWLSSKTFHEQDCKTGKTSSYEQYRFSGKNGLELDTSEVINHMLTYGKRLSPGRPLRGLLLATGGLMPQDLFHGGLIDAVLVITTTDGAEHRGQITLWTDRPGRIRKPVMRRPDLFRGPVESGAPNKPYLPEPSRGPNARISGGCKYL